jgi:FkbM family methyltransferase
MKSRARRLLLRLYGCTLWDISIVGFFKRWIKRAPGPYSALKRLELEIFVRKLNPSRYRRSMFINQMKKVSSFVTTNKMTGGYLTQDGEFYLRTPDCLYLYYNFDNDQYTLGDGQGLDFRRALEVSALEKFLIRYLEDGMVVFDIGANNGYYYSLKIAHRLRHSHVFAFEPDLRILYHLRKNIEFNGLTNLTVVPQALSNRVGMARMTALLGANNFLLTKNNPVAATQVECNTLDNFATQSRITRIDLIKVDIEGGEYDFLMGARNSLTRFKPMLVLELNDELLRRSGASTNAVLGLMHSFRYKCFRVRESSDALAVPRTKMRALIESDRIWLDPLTSTSMSA